MELKPASPKLWKMTWFLDMPWCQRCLGSCVLDVVELHASSATKVELETKRVSSLFC